MVTMTKQEATALAVSFVAMKLDEMGIDPDPLTIETDLYKEQVDVTVCIPLNLNVAIREEECTVDPEIAEILDELFDHSPLIGDDLR